MSESLPVELNDGSVHAVDAPETFTSRGPFHLELANEGGAVHVHIHLGDDLSRAAQLREVNHYVETGETVRVPVGTVPGTDEVTGHLEVVTGYGAERERVRVTVITDAHSGSEDGSRRTQGGGGGAQREGEEPRRGPDPATRTGNGPDPGSASTSAGGRSTGHAMEQSATGMGVRGLANRSLPDVPLSVDTVTREGAAFVVLAAVAAAIGLAVILTVGDLVISLVVAAVVTGAVAVAGWLLLG